MFSSSSLWDNPVLLAAFERLSPEEKIRYQKLGNDLYGVNFQDPKVIEFNYASTINQMLKDGLNVKDLTSKEKEIFVNAYGLWSLKQYEK
jgi:hypothetical protein